MNKSDDLADQVPEKWKPPETQIIELGANQSIIIQVDGQGTGRLTSKGFKEVCPFCSRAGCERSCGESQAADNANGEEDRLLYNAAVDGMESLLLALACTGINVTEVRYQQAVQTVLDAIGNHYA